MGKGTKDPTTGQYSLASAKDFTKELVASTPSQRNYKGILIALLVICAICGLILFAIYLLRPPDDGPRVKGRKVTLADTISKHFAIHPFNGTWLSDEEILYRDARGGISIYNTTSLESRFFLANTTFRQLYANKFAVSPDQQYVLFKHDVKRVWDRSSLAKYTIYDIGNEFNFDLNPHDEKSRDMEQAQLQYVEWGPNGNAIILVYKNDIYYKAAINGSRTIQITTSGQPGVFFNGVPDWIYEVTVLKSPKALWMSPNGKFLLYASFNDSLVGEVSFPWYGDTLPYPSLRHVRYPKAGTTNPEVNLWVVNLDGGNIRPILITTPSVADPRNHYLVNVQWIDDQEVSIVWMNRKQTEATFSTCSTKDWLCTPIYSLKPPGISWLEFPQAPIFSTKRDKCLLRVPLRDGENGYFHHVVRLDTKTRQVVPVTNGQLEVTQISAWDQLNQFIYFIAIPPNTPGERHLYRVREKDVSNSFPTCLTCPSEATALKHKTKHFKKTFDVVNMDYDYTAEVTEEFVNDTIPAEPETCLYNNAIFSPTAKFYVRECLGPEFPIVTFHQGPSGKLLDVLNSNAGLNDEIENLGLPIVKTFQVEVSGGYLATARMFLPGGFREGEDFRFPLVLHVAETPDEQLVSQKWKLTWVSYLTSQKNFIVVEIDGRGIAHRERGIFGGIQASDQLEVIQYLRDNLSFIDERNIGIWGTGYGGYLALLILAQDFNSLFKCGISVAPITKWEFYNSVQTERFLGSPNLTETMENPGWYEEGDLTVMVNKLRGKKFLIIHGTADEKVHYQHTLHLTRALIMEGVPFNEQIYPDEGHRFSRVLEHLHNTMESYFDMNFDPTDWEDWEKANFLGIKV